MARRRSNQKRDKNGKFLSRAGTNKSRGANLKNLKRGQQAAKKKHKANRLRTGLKVAAVVGGTAAVSYSVHRAVKDTKAVQSREQRVRARDRVMSRSQIRNAITAQNNFIHGTRTATAGRMPTGANRVFHSTRNGTTTARRRK